MPDPSDSNQLSFVTSAPLSVKDLLGSLLLISGFSGFIVGFDYYVYEAQTISTGCFIIVCMLLVMSGFAILRILRSQVQLDREQRAISTSWWFFIEFCKSSLPMNDYDSISIDQISRSSRYGNYSVFPVAITSPKHESICVAVVNHVFAARKLARKISAFTGFPVSDATLVLTKNLLSRDVAKELSEIQELPPLRNVQQIHLKTALILMFEVGLVLPLILYLIRTRNLYCPVVISFALALLYVTVHLMEGREARKKQGSRT